MKKHIVNLLVYCLITTLATLNFGCSPKRPLPIETHLDLHSKKIALVPSKMPIQNSLDLYANGRVEGALKGAGSGAATTMSAMGSGGGSCDGDFCGLVVLFYLAATVVGGTIGSIYGAVTSPSGKTVDKMEEGLGEKTQNFLSQLTFAQLLEEKASREPSIDIDLTPLEFDGEGLTSKDYERLKLQGFQELISAELTEIKFVGGKGKDPRLKMTLKAVVDIVDLDHQDKSLTRTFSYSGPSGYYSEWIAMGADEVLEAFEFAIRALIDEIYYDIFVTADLQLTSGYVDFSGTKKFGCCWICPESPPLDYSYLKKELQYPLVDSLLPTLKWSSFPNVRQRKQFTHKVGKEIDDTSYDLKIWQGLGAPVYQATDITDNYHRLETALIPESRYYWSVRACLEVVGKKVCTKWASSTLPFTGSNPFEDYCERKNTSMAKSMANFYRFKTPALMTSEDVEKLRSDVEFENQTIIVDQSEYKAGDIVLVEFKNGNTRKITITNINDRFLVGYYDFELGHYQISNSWDTRSIKSMTHAAK